MPKSSIYTVGGTVQAGGGIYIKRKADDELLELCRAGELAFILSSRQVGKSSLMIRTAQQLEIENIRSGIIDLSKIGVQVTQDEWYLGILNEISDSLNLETDIFAWWTQFAGLGHAQRFFNFLRDVLLKEIIENIVFFFDEIDTTLSIPFADDFFASLRAAYNARSTVPEFKRLSFVLVGVATPSDLISDSKRTPFNIGERVDLNDFTLDEAMPLAQGLGENADKVLVWIFEWSGGHPYLTQRICAHLSKSNDAIDEQVVTHAVEDLFFGEQGQQDNNLQFVRDMLLERSPDARRVMLTYGDIRSGKKILDDERSIIKAHLKISGVVNKQAEQLVTRNRIYERTFDQKWIKENTPSAVPRRIMIGSTLAVLLALFIAAYFAYQEYTRTDAESATRFEQGFQSAKTENNIQAELKNMAGLFELDGYSDDARALFNQLTQDEKLQLLAPADSRGARKNQMIIVNGLYQSMANTDDGNALLQAMINAVNHAEPTSDLDDEITAWFNGRMKLNGKDFYSAEANFMLAIEKNSENPAVYYDLAQAHIGMNRYPAALDDLARLIQLDKNRGSDAYRLIQFNPLFDRYWVEHKKEEKYAELAKAITIPMVLIPAGEFAMGSTADHVDEAFAECQQDTNNRCTRDEFRNEEPLHKAFLDAFYIDQFEVTNARYAECVAAGVCQPPQSVGSFTRESYYGNAEFDNYPVINVTWFEANTYCEWRGARLPTEAEWEKAARGTDGRIYPWGDTFDGTRTNFCDKNCTNNWANKRYDDGYAETSPVGSYESGQSPYGVYDMVGNVWEWAADWYSETYYQDSPVSNPVGPDSGQFRVLRGGSWYIIDVSVRSARRWVIDPTFTNNAIGFRCARSP